MGKTSPDDLRELHAKAAKVMGWRVFDDYDEWVKVRAASSTYPCITWSDQYDGQWILWRNENADGHEWAPSTQLGQAWELGLAFTRDVSSDGRNRRRHFVALVGPFDESILFVPPSEIAERICRAAVETREAQ